MEYLPSDPEERIKKVEEIGKALEEFLKKKTSLKVTVLAPYLPSTNTIKVMLGTPEVGVLKAQAVAFSPQLLNLLRQYQEYAPDNISVSYFLVDSAIVRVGRRAYLILANKDDYDSLLSKKKELEAVVNQMKSSSNFSTTFNVSLELQKWAKLEVQKQIELLVTKAKEFMNENGIKAQVKAETPGAPA